MKVFLRMPLWLVIVGELLGSSLEVADAFTIATRTTSSLGQRNVNRFPPTIGTSTPTSTASRSSILLHTIAKKRTNEDQDETPWVFEWVAKFGGSFGGVTIKKEEHQDHAAWLQQQSQAHQDKFVVSSIALVVAYVGTCLFQKVLFRGPSLTILMGQLLAAGGISSVARRATRKKFANNGLASTPYKQLNLVLTMYGIMMGVLGVGAAMGSSNIAAIATSVGARKGRLFLLCLWEAVSLATVLHSFKGYAVGVNQGWIFEEQPDGRRRYLKDLASQAKNMVRNVLPIPFPKNLQAFVYWAASATVAGLNGMALMDIISQARSAASPSIAWTSLINLSMLGPLMGVFLILKDDAEQGSRLEGINLVGLNFLAAVASAFVSYVASRQGFLCSTVDLATRVACATSLFSTSTALFAIQGLIAKK